MSAGAPSASDAIGLSRANLVRAIRLPRSGTAPGVIPEHWPSPPSSVRTSAVTVPVSEKKRSRKQQEPHCLQCRDYHRVNRAAVRERYAEGGPEKARED